MSGRRCCGKKKRRTDPGTTSHAAAPSRATPSPRRPAPSPAPANLPGYSYDPIKKRYFKIDSMAPPPSPKKPAIKPRELEKPEYVKCPGSFLALLRSRQLGTISSHLFEKRALQASAFRLKKQVVTAPCHRGTVTHLQINESQDTLLASAKSGHGASLWKYSISKCNKFYIHLKRDANVHYSPVSEITDMNFLPQVVRPGCVALISLLGGAGQHGRVSLLDLDQGTFLSTYYVPQSNVWSCCWNKQDHHSLCIGASREAYVQDIVTNTRQVLFTGKSDVLCIRSVEASPIVFTGSRNKLLICHDLRAKEAAFQIEHQSSVGDVKLMKSENTLICSAFNGQVVQWDIRTQRHVVAYRGHVNDYAPVKMKVDESESLLFIPGKDLQTRIWAVDTGNLINILPPPAEDSNISNHNIPACEVGLEWGGFYPGFAIAATGLLHWYSL